MNQPDKNGEQICGDSSVPKSTMTQTLWRLIQLSDTYPEHWFLIPIEHELDFRASWESRGNVSRWRKPKYAVRVNSPEEVLFTGWHSHSITPNTHPEIVNRPSWMPPISEVDELAADMAACRADNGDLAVMLYETGMRAGKDYEEMVGEQARRALFAPASEKAAKVGCPNCWQLVATNEEHVSSRNRDSFTCQPAASIDTTKTVAYCDELEARYGQPAPPEPEKVAKVETGTVPCPNCGVLGLDEYDHRKLDQFGTAFDKGGGFTCQPAPPEPAAREMPEAVRDAVDTLRSGVPSYPTWRQYADTLESWWRNLAQPLAGGMTEELEHVLSIAERDLRYKEECFDDSARTVHDERIERLRAAIAAVREQFGKRPKLEKVRGALSWLKMQYEPGSQGYTPNATVWKMTEAALAELDAAEGKGEGRG